MREASKLFFADNGGSAAVFDDDGLYNRWCDAVEGVIDSDPDAASFDYDELREYIQAEVQK
jgi:hypothetical protein